jgi:hypothetical protein
MCRGEVKYTCTGCSPMALVGCYKTEGSCQGFGWPAFMSCKGTYVDRTTMIIHRTAVVRFGLLRNCLL